jgi:hypothetical protein
MNKKYSIAIIAASLFFVQCGEGELVEETATEETSSEEVVEEVVEEEAEVNVDSLVNAIQSSRSAIESDIADLEKLELPTGGLRPQISQKWSAIHFYSRDGELVRIKTYPYDHSNRSEEFYLENGALVLAAIEDEGADKVGPSEEFTGKLYYYHNDHVIHETNDTEEDEGTIRESDAERLLQECAEYKLIFRENKGNS